MANWAASSHRAAFLLLVCMVGCGGVGEPPPEASGTLATTQSALIDSAYVPDPNPDLPNPERGVAYWATDSSPSDPYTVANHFLYLGDWCRAPLIWNGRNVSGTSSVLNDWANEAIAQRDAGRKVIFRPRYDTTAAEGAPNSQCHKVEATSYDLMQDHVQVIGQMLGDPEIRPTLAFLEMGYLGSWGEWNVSGTDCGSSLAACQNYAPTLLASSTGSDRITFGEFVIDTYRIFGVTRPVGLRRPEFYRDIRDNMGVPGQYMGFYNDCFMRSGSDGGTFSQFEPGYTPAYGELYSTPGNFPLASDAKAFMQAEAGRGTQGGENCSPLTDNSDHWKTMAPDAVVQRFDDDGYHYFHPGTRDAPPVDFREYMVGNGRWDTIKRRLGYRYHITAVNSPASAPPSGSITVSIAIQNSGFAKLPFDRTAYLVLVGPSGSFIVGTSNPKPETYTLLIPSFQSNQLARLWTDNATTTFTSTFPAPWAPGTYTLHLYLPDVDCIGNLTCSDTVKANYAVRLATLRNGVNVFNTTTGTNNLDVTLTVSGGPTTVGTISPGSFAVSYDANSAYFTYLAPELCSGGLEIEKMSLSTGAKTPLLSGGCSSPSQSASDGTSLFYAGMAARDILSKTVAGSSPPPVMIADAPNVLSGTGLKVDATRVYYADFSAIRSVAKTGGSVTTLFTGQNTSAVLGLDATSVYFQTHVSSPCCSYQLRKVPVGGGAPPPAGTLRSW